MTEDDARRLVTERFGDDLAARAGQFLDMVVSENDRQNLIAASTIPHIWARHAVDSLQLLTLAGGRNGVWIDIGSGGGFPGMMIALGRTDPTMLVEPRKRRAEFLQGAVDQLGLSARVTIVSQKIEAVPQQAAILSARAVAGIERLFDMAHHCSGSQTRWVLPRGRIDPEEIAILRRRWTFVFHVEQSDVDASSQIAVFDKVSRR